MRNRQNFEHPLFRLIASTRIKQEGKSHSVYLISGCVVLLFLFLIGFIIYSKYKTGEGICRLRKISAFNVDEELLRNFTQGQLCICTEQPESKVKIYPVFQSGKPLYGSIRFAEEYGREDSGILYHFALDESQGTDKGYDRFYFDSNRDLDLSNDKSQLPLKRPPKGATQKNPYLKKQICFSYLYIDFEDDSAGRRPLEIMPRLMLYDSGYVNLTFVTTEARRGRIRISGHRYDVLLGHNYLVSGRFNRPWTALHLIPDGNFKKQFHWSNADRLMAVHKIEGTYYCFSATPEGDKLTAQPYNGKLGTFMGGSGDRDMTYIGCSGSLCSKDKAVAITGELAGGWPESSYKFHIPVGDYLPSSLSIQYDKLTVSISDNYHADGKLRGKISGQKYYGITIREDKPFVFDFSNEPKVIFASPAKDYHLKPSEELTVKAVLIDPEMDIMIRRLYDVGRGRKWITLDPKVIITRANGEKVDEGVMPFG